MPSCDSSGTSVQAVRPEPSPRRPAVWLDRRCLRGLPVLVHEVSRRVWGLRLRRTRQELALTLLPMLPSAHYKVVGVRIYSFRSWLPTPPIPLFTLRGLPRDRTRAKLGAERIATPFS